MRVLINASNLKQGGGVQVADSICRYLGAFPRHSFVVVLSSAFKGHLEVIESFPNVSVVPYDFRNSLASLLFQRDMFLDSLVAKQGVDIVMTVFGPSRWKPRVPHLCGFARAHILPMDTPYFLSLTIKERFVNSIVKHSFSVCSDYYWTENPSVSELLGQVFPKKHIYTVSNCYNQVFDDPCRWRYHSLPQFDGITLLTITNAYKHKNLSIAIDIARLLKKNYPDFAFRFVLTVNKSDLPPLEPSIETCFLLLGAVDVTECPSLYQQSDIMFQPSLLECFSATYPEAMRMEVPIVTTDLMFSHGLCGNAALYYSPLSADDASEQIVRLAHDKALGLRLVEEGKRRLSLFLNAEQRAVKLMNILESMV